MRHAHLQDFGSHWNVLEERDGELVGAQRPLRRTNKLLQMRISPFFRLLSERELELLSLGSTYFTVEKGEALVVQGDSCESIYVIVKGIIRVLIGAKGAGKWGMHRISRDKNNPRHGDGSATGTFCSISKRRNTENWYVSVP